MYYNKNHTEIASYSVSYIVYFKKKNDWYLYQKSYFILVCRYLYYPFDNQSIGNDLTNKYSIYYSFVATLYKTY